MFEQQIGHASVTRSRTLVKRLLTALVGLWDATPASDEGDLPVAMKRAVYKAMAGVMTPKQVVTELGALVKAGLHVN